jgi:hypothetical protein
MNPLDAMEKLLLDLRLHCPVFEGAVLGQAFDVVGGFKYADCTGGTMVAGTLNVGGLDDFKLNMAILLMMQSNIDVLVLTDTRHTATSADYYRKLFQTRMGCAARTSRRQDNMNVVNSVRRSLAKELQNVVEIVSTNCTADLEESYS